MNYNGLGLYFLFNLTLYCFLGWIIENLYSLIINGSFQQDGFLIGPFKPMYGLAMSFLILVDDILGLNMYNFFIICFCVPTIIEYLTGIIMLKIFRKKYWDYSGLKYNYKGVVSLKFSLYWTILTFIGVKYFQKVLIAPIYLSIDKYWVIVAPIFLLTIIIDNILSSVLLYKRARL